MTIDTLSPTWIAIKAQADEAINKAQIELEVPGLPLARTEFLRGELSAWRSVLAAAAPSPNRTISSPNYSV